MIDLVGLRVPHLKAVDGLERNAGTIGQLKSRKSQCCASRAYLSTSQHLIQENVPYTVSMSQLS
jgi:hypothetical protein